VASLTSPMSRRQTDEPRRIGILPSSSGLCATAFDADNRHLVGDVDVARRLMTLPSPRAVTTSARVTPCVSSFLGSTFSTIVRWLPPKGGGADTPGQAGEDRPARRTGPCLQLADRPLGFLVARTR